MTDENDNAPVFSQPVYNLTVKEDLTNLPKAIGQITAEDPDLDENAKVIYSLISGNTGKIAKFCSSNKILLLVYSDV